MTLLVTVIKALNATLHPNTWRRQTPNPPNPSNQSQSNSCRAHSDAYFFFTLRSVRAKWQKCWFIWGKGNLKPFQGTNKKKIQTKCEDWNIFSILSAGLQEADTKSKYLLQKSSLREFFSVPLWGGLWVFCPLYFFSFLRLPGRPVRLLLWNVLWDKRSGDPQTQWPPREASLLLPFPLLLLFLFFHLRPLFRCSFSSPRFLSVSLCTLMWCRPGTLAWPLSSFSYLKTHTKHGYILQQHKLVHAHTHSHK